MCNIKQIVGPCKLYDVSVRWQIEETNHYLGVHVSGLANSNAKQYDSVELYWIIWQAALLLI